MPGLRQLREFSSTVKALGNESERRAARGQIMPKLELPTGIPEESDSEDFVFGLPDKDAVPYTPPMSTESPDSDEVDIAALLAEAHGGSAGDGQRAADADISGFGGESAELFPAEDTIAADVSGSQADSSDLDALLNGFSFPDMDGLGGDDDVLGALAAFDAPEVVPVPEEPDALGAPDASSDVLDAGLFTPEDFAGAPEGAAGNAGKAAPADDIFLSPEDFSIDTGDTGDIDAVAPVPADDADFDIGSVLDADSLLAAEPLPDGGFQLEDTAPEEASGFDLADTEVSDAIPLAEPLDAPAGLDSLDLGSFDLPDDFDLVLPDTSELDGAAGAAEAPEEASGFDLADVEVSDAIPLGDESFDTGSILDADSPTTSAFDDASAVPAAPADTGDSFDTAGLDDFDTDPVPSTPVDGGDSFDTAGLDDFDFNLDGMDFPADSGSERPGADEAFSFDAGAVPETAGEGVDSAAPGDIPSLDSADSFDDAGGGGDGFDFAAGDAIELGDFDMPGVGLSDDSIDLGTEGDDGLLGLDGSEVGSGDDFEINNSFDSENFSIPGFSGFEMADSSSSAEFSAPSAESKSKKKKEAEKRTSLTDEENELFMRNLAYYPLNLRLAIEEAIVSNDFTEEVIFELVEKVLKRISARQLAGFVEKLVDKHIPVPSNYEKRTAEEYEAYKQSTEYQLKNRIIPFTLVGLVAAGLIALMVFLVGRFVVRPVRAELLYKEGYNLMQNGLYPQSVQKFDQAVYFRPVKKWFFTYARGFRAQRQYDRAGEAYEKLLRRYNYDKQAGLEYARMQLDDLINYERAETIVRRWVLDYHINDADAMLLLGDIFLEWATATDNPAHYEDARLQYATLIELYGRTDTYLSRMMRYFIRTDQIREVLPLKNYFYPRLKKHPLEPQDLVELSGYMMDKLYGYLAPQDEFLRSSIEDVRDMLEKAVTAAPDIPESVYNYGRYFVETGNTDSARRVLTEALNRFAACDRMTHPRMIRHINTYRLLGELAAADQEYITARQLYTDGLDLFTRERRYSALATDPIVGKLYSDMADLDYFISGDLDTALTNYGHAIANLHDTPSIRYRVGYIQYSRGNYREALGSFIKTVTEEPSERNALLALGNTLVLRNSIEAARGYYDKLIALLDLERDQSGVLYPQVHEEEAVLVDTYMKAANNLAVVLSRLASQNGDSSLNGQAMVYLQESIRAWDALTRNQSTMIRLEGSNLAAQNLRYLTLPNAEYESEIYTAIPRTLLGETVLTQGAVTSGKRR